MGWPSIHKHSITHWSWLSFGFLGKQCTDSCCSATATATAAASKTMATTSKVLSRLSCRLKLLSHTRLHKPSSSSSLSPSAPRFISRTSRLPVELGSVGSMMPLHSAVASARLVSSLCIESQGWCLVPQGISMPL